MYTKIKEFLMRDWNPAERAMIILCCISTGITEGLLLTPIKGDTHCGSDNGNRYSLDSEDYTFDSDDKQ